MYNVYEITGNLMPRRVDRESGAQSMTQKQRTIYIYLASVHVW